MTDKELIDHLIAVLRRQMCPTCERIIGRDNHSQEIPCDCDSARKLIDMKITEESLLKVLNNDGTSCNGGSGKWNLPVDGQPGDWMPPISNIHPCKRGYHLGKGSQVLYWLGPTLWVAEGRGEHIEDENKIVFAQARLVQKIEGWTERTAQLFAADCAEHVLHCYNDYATSTAPALAIAAARDFANGKITKEQLSAAESAAESARSAAESAAWAAARSAARSAEIEWQWKRLLMYINERSQ